MTTKGAGPIVKAVAVLAILGMGPLLLSCGSSGESSYYWFTVQEDVVVFDIPEQGVDEYFGFVYRYRNKDGAYHAVEGTRSLLDGYPHPLMARKGTGYALIIPKGEYRMPSNYDQIEVTGHLLGQRSNSPTEWSSVHTTTTAAHLDKLDQTQTVTLVPRGS